MTSNIKIFLTAIIAAIIGLGIGYFIFGNKSAAPIPTEHHHEGASQSDPNEIWTCSMHPQIRRNEPGVCPICEMDLIPLETNTSNDPLVLQMTNEAVELMNIQTSLVGGSGTAAKKTIRLSGKVQADERLASSLVAHVPGRIEKLFVSFTGEQVKEGQPLATVYSPKLISAQQELLEAIKLQDLSPGLLEAARNKLRFWKISDATIQSIEARGKVQETFTLYAAATGIVTNRRVSVGDYLQQGEPLFELMNLSKVWVLFDAYEEDLAGIKIGNSISFSTPAIPNKIYKSRITFIDPIINPTTRVAALRAEVSNPNGLLKPEMFVNASLQKSGSQKGLLSIPKSAVLWTGKRSVVYVKVPDASIPSFQFREVELGEALGDQYQILRGLETGEEVVTYGSFTIDAAAQLNNQASMMNKKVSLKGNDQYALPNYQSETPEEFKKQLEQVAMHYINLKDALIATDATAAAKEAKLFLTTLDKVDMQLLKGEAHLYWMEQRNALESHSQKINTLLDVEEQRRQFGVLSETVIRSLKVFGTSTEVLYVQYCPMALGDKGANWLALEEKIQNPYFGDKMLSCGVVKEQIQK